MALEHLQAAQVIEAMPLGRFAASEPLGGQEEPSRALERAHSET